MKKFVIYVVVVFTCAISAFFIYRGIQASHYANTAVPYIHEVLPRISTWNPDLAVDYMAPEVLARVTPEQLANLMRALSRIGELQSIGQPQFKNKSTGGDVNSAQKPVVSYEVEAQYSTGEATVLISLLDLGDSFKVYHFNFQTQALVQ